MDDLTELFTIGQLSRRTGLTVRSIRFWSDLGLVPVTTRSTGGYRLYDTDAVARLDLLRTLRELGLELAAVRRVLERQSTLAEVAGAHARALDVELRTLRLRRAVLRWVATQGGTTEELSVMHELARCSARERQQIIDDFVTEVFAGIPPEAPGAPLAEAMRGLPAELPDEPTDAEVHAWLELAELVDDADFRRRVREMATAGASGAGAPRHDTGPALERATSALTDGIPPDSAAGQELLNSALDPPLTGAERTALADQLATFTDRRVERYWHLLGVLNQRPPFPAVVPAMEWLIAALRAS